MNPRVLVALALAGFVVSLAVSVASRGEPAPAGPPARAFVEGPRLRPIGDIGAAPKTPAAPAQAAPAPAPVRDGVSVYRGTGAWVDQYDTALLDDPYPALAEMRRRGVRTVYWETGSWRLPRSWDFRDQEATELAIDQSH